MSGVELISAQLFIMQWNQDNSQDGIIFAGFHLEFCWVFSTSLSFSFDFAFF